MSKRPNMPYLAHNLIAVVADIPTDNLGTAICLNTDSPDIDELGPWLDPEREGFWTAERI